jgi:hypothetical protein
MLMDMDGSDCARLPMWIESCAPGLPGLLKDEVIVWFVPFAKNRNLHAMFPRLYELRCSQLKTMPYLRKASRRKVMRLQAQR